MGRPKQFLPLAGSDGRGVVVEAASSRWTRSKRVVLVLGEDALKEHGARLASGKVKVVAAGPTRMGSVRNGFAALPRGHRDCGRARRGAVDDHAPDRRARRSLRPLNRVRPSPPCRSRTRSRSLRRGRRISETPERARFWTAQTPQTYRYSILKEALEKFAGEADATDESQLVERCGHEVSVVESSYENFKITTPEDITMATAIFEARPEGRRESRTGFGYDIHKLVAGRELWLAGVKLPHHKGLLGHSDGDAVLHACCDAVLGALGPRRDRDRVSAHRPEVQGAASSERYRRSHLGKIRRLRRRGIVHLDATLIAEEPKLKPHYEKLKTSLAALFKLPESRVSLKAKSNEGLDAIGRGEAIACHAVATVLARWRRAPCILIVVPRP